jgi:hypothetical protein
MPSSSSQTNLDLNSVVTVEEPVVDTVLDAELEPVAETVKVTEVLAEVVIVLDWVAD